MVFVSKSSDAAGYRSGTGRSDGENDGIKQSVTDSESSGNRKSKVRNIPERISAMLWMRDLLLPYYMQIIIPFTSGTSACGLRVNNSDTGLYMWWGWGFRPAALDLQPQSCRKSRRATMCSMTRHTRSVRMHISSCIATPWCKALCACVVLVMSNCIPYGTWKWRAEKHNVVVWPLNSPPLTRNVKVCFVVFYLLLSLLIVFCRKWSISRQVNKHQLAYYNTDFDIFMFICLLYSRISP